MDVSPRLGILKSSTIKKIRRDFRGGIGMYMFNQDVWHVDKSFVSFSFKILLLIENFKGTLSHSVSR